MVNQSTVFVLIATMLLAAAVASALYVNSVSAQMSNSTSAKNMTNATMAGNMTKKTANMTSGAFNTTNKAKWNLWFVASQQLHQIFTICCNGGFED